MTPIRRAMLSALAALAFGAAAATADEPVPPSLVLPLPDAGRGLQVFADKGCVVCHSVNGIGGRAGPALDGETWDNEIAPLDFAARMWRGARAMSVLQSMQFGYQIELSGADIADLAAFVASDEARAGFSADDIPPAFRGWTINSAIGGFAPEGGTPGMDAAEEARLVAVTRGYVLAERWCAGCHAVLRSGDYGAAGPGFADIAARPETTAGTIRARLSRPHRDMPETLALTDADIDDLAAYILSMRR